MARVTVIKYNLPAVLDPTVGMLTKRYFPSGEVLTIYYHNYIDDTVPVVTADFGGQYPQPSYTVDEV